MIKTCEIHLADGSVYQINLTKSMVCNLLRQCIAMTYLEDIPCDLIKSCDKDVFGLDHGDIVD